MMMMTVMMMMIEMMMITMTMMIKIMHWGKYLPVGQDEGECSNGNDDDDDDVEDKI